MGRGAVRTVKEVRRPQKAVRELGSRGGQAMLNRVLALFLKELYQVWREPKMRAMLFGPPVVQLIVFGYAVNLDVENSRLAWMDQDRSPETRVLREAFEGSSYFTITDFPQSGDEVTALLDRGEVEAVVQVAPGFARRLRRGERGEIQALIDGSNSNTASIVSSYVSEVVNQFSRDQARKRLDLRSSLHRAIPESVRRGVVSLESRVWFNPNLESRDYYVPGVVVNIIAIVTVMLTAMAIVREKEIGTMEQLMVTPIRPLELILGKTLPFAVIGLLEVVMVTGAALLIFGIPLRGNPLFLLATAVLFLLTTLGAGLLISTLSETQQQAMMGTFFFFLPAFMLSGFAFPIRNMPVVVQYLTYLNPVRYYLEVARGIFLKGSGWEVLWPQLVALALLGLATLGFSALRFRKRLD